MKSISEVKNAVYRNSPAKFVIFQEIEWPSTGGVDLDALPTRPVSVPISRIREIRPAKTWKTWDNTVEIWTAGNKIAVRGTLEEIVNKLNGHSDTRNLFALTPREERLHRMREDGYSMNEIALAFNEKSSLRIAMDLSAIDKKLEAAAAPRRLPSNSGAGRSGTGRVLIRASEGTLAMMRDPNIHPDATT